MNLVSNYIGAILPNQIEGAVQGITQGINAVENGFEELLAKQMEKIPEQININISGNIGMPSGLNIGDFDTANPILQNEGMNPVNKVNEIDNSGMPDFKNIKDMTTSEVVTFVTSLFDNKPTLTQTTDTGLFSFERKLAANTYGKYAKGLVTDLQDFVADTLKLS